MMLQENRVSNRMITPPWMKSFNQDYQVFQTKRQEQIVCVCLNIGFIKHYLSYKVDDCDVRLHFNLVSPSSLMSSAMLEIFLPKDYKIRFSFFL